MAQKNVPEPCIPDAHADNSGEYIQQMDWESEEATAAKTRDFGTQTENVLLVCEMGTQTLMKDAVSHQESQTFQVKMKHQTTQTKMATSIVNFMDSLKMNDKKCLFYTGLKHLQLIALFNFLSPACENLTFWTGKSKNTKNNIDKRKLKPFEQLVLVLARLRAGLLVQDMSLRFEISTGLISKTVQTWIQFLNNEFCTHLKPLMFPSRKIISENLPKTFKSMKNIRALFDCTEFRCQSPSNFEHQGNLYSAYKAHTTFKVFVACTPNDSICFVSDVYEGSISDREIFIRSQFVEALEPGDLVIGDRGFTVHDIVEQKRAHLNIPPFLNGRSCLSQQEECETKRIAKQRIYIEHAIGRMKQFRILQRNLPLNMRGLINPLIFVCSCLANFQEPIVLD